MQQQTVDRRAAVRAAVTVSGLVRRHGRGRRATTALDGVDLAFAAGRMTAIMGASGSGKSTLLHCAAGLARPTAGRVRLGGTDLTTASEREMSRIRRRRIGIVFQDYNLVPMLDAAQNVALPLRLDGRRPGRRRIADALERVGLAGLERRRPAELSGGQQQRVAIARALVAGPEVVFADEPTGALDRATGAGIVALLRSAVDDGVAVVLATHDIDVGSRADRVVLLADGRVRAETDRPEPALLDRLLELG